MFFYWLVSLINIFKYDLGFSFTISIIYWIKKISTQLDWPLVYFSSRLTAESWDRQARYHRLSLLWAKQLYQSYSSLLLKANSRGMITFSVSWMKIWILLIFTLALGLSFKLIGKAFLLKLQLTHIQSKKTKVIIMWLPFSCYFIWSAYYL